MVEGKSLASRFSDAPYGWSQDTLRYLVAAMLVGGVIKLKVSGREVTVNGQQAIEALKTNNAFKNVGVSLREDRPSMEMLALAATRLTELSGDMVVPLEDEISKAVAKLFSSCSSAMPRCLVGYRHWGCPAMIGWRPWAVIWPISCSPMAPMLPSAWGARNLASTIT